MDMDEATGSRSRSPRRSSCTCVSERPTLLPGNAHRGSDPSTPPDDQHEWRRGHHPRLRLPPHPPECPRPTPPDSPVDAPRFVRVLGKRAAPRLVIHNCVAALEVIIATPGLVVAPRGQVSCWLLLRTGFCHRCAKIPSRELHAVFGGQCLLNARRLDFAGFFHALSQACPDNPECGTIAILAGPIGGQYLLPQGCEARESSALQDYYGFMLNVNNYSFRCRVFVRTFNAIHRIGTNQWR